MAEANQQGSIFIGEGVSITGSLDVPDIISISGKVEGSVTARQVIVEATGHVQGKVQAELVDVKGSISEYLAASKSLIIRSTGDVKGTVYYSEIEIEKGGQLQGDLYINA
jgi:cytoskeletal protein CcmA (bactofilin family)